MCTAVFKKIQMAYAILSKKRDAYDTYLENRDVVMNQDTGLAMDFDSFYKTFYESFDYSGERTRSSPSGTRSRAGRRARNDDNARDGNDGSRQHRDDHASKGNGRASRERQHGSGERREERNQFFEGDQEDSYAAGGMSDADDCSDDEREHRRIEDERRKR